MGLLSLSFFLPSSSLYDPLAFTLLFFYLLLYLWPCWPTELYLFLWALTARLPCFYLLLHLWACGPIGLYFQLSFFFGLLWPFCFAFTFYCAYEPACCHFLPYWSTKLYFFLSSSLGFYDPFASILLFYSFLLYFCLLSSLYAVESPLSFFFFFFLK